jgi:putative ABC transport system permease protein
MILRMAWRNLRRRPIQSLLASAAVGAGLAVCILSVNFQYGVWETAIQDSVSSTSGHIVVQPAGYQETKDSKLLLEGSGAIATKLAALDPDATVLRRAFLAGLVASPNNTVAIQLAAVEPALEGAVSPMKGKIIQGGWFEDETKSRVLIGVDLAQRLQVDVGDKVVVTTSSKGELQARPVRIGGIFETHNTRTDSFFGILPLAVAHKLLPELDDPATQVALVRGDLDVPPELLAQAKAAVGAGPEVLTWQGAMPELESAEKLDKAGGRVIWAFLAIIATVGILNVLLMSLFQRTRELGVMLAVGMRPMQVGRLLVAEGFLLGVVGSFFGYLAGLAATWPMKEYGIELTAMSNQMPTANAAVDTLLRSQYIVDQNIYWAVFFVFLSVLSSLWPAFRAARLEPVDSIRAL